MISYIKGTITFKSPTYIIVEAGGIGYRVNISLNTYAKVESLEHVKILTHFHVKEDSQTLYGFAEDEERSLFGHLISVGLENDHLLAGMDARAQRETPEFGPFDIQGLV